MIKTTVKKHSQTQNLADDNKAKAETPNVERAAYSLNDWCFRWNTSRPMAYKLAKAGKLKLSKIGNKTIVTAQADQEFAARAVEDACFADNLALA